MHHELKTQVVETHRAPIEGRCDGGPAAAEATSRIQEFDKIWTYDQPWPPVGDFVSGVGSLDDFLIELGYAYLTAREANPRRAFVVFSEHAHRFPRSTRGKLGRVHAQLTIGDLSSAEQALAELTRAKPERGATAAAEEESLGPPEAVGEGTLPAPWARQEAEFVRWVMGYLNCRPGADGLTDRGPEKNGAEDLTGAASPVNFFGMEQLKEPPRPGPLSYVGFVLTPVTFFGERVIDLVQRDDALRMQRWTGLAVLPGRSGAGRGSPAVNVDGSRTWHVAGFMRGQAAATPEEERDWTQRSARFLACSLRPRWAGQWVPRLHDAPDLGYFPHYADLYATLGRLSLVQGERASIDDVCDALVSLLLASHQEPADPGVASEIAWLWYVAMQRDDPEIARRQPFLAPEHRFGEQAALRAADLLEDGTRFSSPASPVRELQPALERSGALSPSRPYQDDGPLAVAGFRVLAALLFQVGPEVQREREGNRLTAKAQEILERLATPSSGRGEKGHAGAVAGDPWRLTSRSVPGSGGAAAPAAAEARRPLEPWHDPVFTETRWLLESWLGALEQDLRGDPAALERCALVRDRLWRR